MQINAPTVGNQLANNCEPKVTVQIEKDAGQLPSPRPVGQLDLV
jgi:hypothetical protein